MDKELLSTKFIGLTFNTLQDIFDVHRCFVFNNFNFKIYSLKKYINNINNNDILLNINININKHQLNNNFNLTPHYIINDKIFKILNYLNASSLIINKIRKNINYNFNTKFIIIPKSVISVFDDDILFNYLIN